MKKNVIGIIILILLIPTSFSAVGTLNDKSIELTKSLKTNLFSNDVFWSEDFDSYNLGQCIDGGSDDGGWEIFRDWHITYIVDDQFRSEPHSVEISNGAEIWHRFSDVYSGNWTFTGWVYIPEDFNQKTSIFFLSYYKLTPFDYYCQFGIEFDGERDLASISFLRESATSVNLPLIRNQWVEIRVEIYFEDDWFECYYNDELLTEREWSEGKSAWYEGKGFLCLAGVNLYYCVDPDDDPNYYDDLSLEGEPTGIRPDLECEGSIIWTCKTKETYTGYFTVQNNGMPNSRLEWIVDEYPEWGEWSFQPKFGRLTPEDDSITVEVTVKSPERRGEYDGVLKIIAVGDPDDYHEIPVHGSFHKNKSYSYHFNQWRWLSDRNQIFERLLNLIMQGWN